MNSVTFNSISGLNPPYLVYACNVYGMGCVLIATINVNVPGSITIDLPPSFISAPAIGIKIITSDGCERFEVLYCEEPCKEFQDLIDFEFQDGVIYCFQG